MFVKPVGTWAYIERVVPKWVRGCDAPIKVMYDCGLGREFTQDELEEESAALQDMPGIDGSQWRLMRGQNRWKSAEQCGHHPFPGTHPVVVTTERDWGGWRVPGAEYDLDPNRIERQAQLLVRAPILFTLLGNFVEHARTEPENLPSTLLELADTAGRVLRQIDQTMETVNEPRADGQKVSVAIPPRPEQAVGTIPTP